MFKLRRVVPVLLLALSPFIFIAVIGWLLSDDEPQAERDSMANVLQAMGHPFDEIHVVNEPGNLFSLKYNGDTLTWEQYERLSQAVHEHFPERAIGILDLSEQCRPESH